MMDAATPILPLRVMVNVATPCVVSVVVLPLILNWTGCGWVTVGVLGVTVVVVGVDAVEIGLVPVPATPVPEEEPTEP